MPTPRRVLAYFLQHAPFLWTGFTAWLAVLFFLSSLPGSGYPAMIIPHQDKVLHFLYFGGGGAVLAAALHASFRLRCAFLLLLVVSVVAAIGALDEYHQYFVPGRSGLDFFDWLADFLGAICGVFVLQRLRARLMPARANCICEAVAKKVVSTHE